MTTMLKRIIVAVGLPLALLVLYFLVWPVPDHLYVTSLVMPVLARLPKRGQAAKQTRR
jgi:hypothetical protein